MCIEIPPRKGPRNERSPGTEKKWCKMSDHESLGGGGDIKAYQHQWMLMPGLCGDTPAMSFHWQDDLGLHESTFHSQSLNEISHGSKKEAVIFS